jgi:cytochrome c-type biogenesis protein
MRPEASLEAVLCDGGGGVGLLAAAFAGLVSFLSPCVLPLVPGYLSTVAGVAPGDMSTAGPRRVLVPAVMFVLAFSAIFVVLGLSATALGASLNEHRALLEKVSAVVITALGVFFLLTPFVLRLNREFHVGGLMQRAGKGGPVVAGAAFAVAWTPCIGPTLGAILSLAATSHSTARGALLLGVYSAGLAVPFLASALFFGYATSAFARVKRHYRVVIAVGGVLLIATGVLLWTGEFARLNAEAQTVLGSIGLDVTTVC